MDFETLENDLNHLIAVIKLSLSATDIVCIIVQNDTNTVALTLFKYFNNGRIDTLLDGFTTDIKQKLNNISHKHCSNDIEYFRTNLLNLVNRRLLDIENRTDAADTENVIYRSVTSKLRNGEKSFTEPEMMTYVSANLHERLKSLSRGVIYEINNLKSLSVKKFTAKQWAIIFHYDYIYGELKSHRFKKDAIKKFLENPNVTTTFSSIKNDENAIKKAISDYSVNVKELEFVLSYIENTFEKTVKEAVEYDITTARDEQSRK